MKIIQDKFEQCHLDVIEWLHEVWALTTNGRPFVPDPFYTRNDVLTEEVVEKVIAKLEEIFLYEIEHFPAYHRTNQGLAEDERLATPGYLKMTYSEKLAVVQGVDRIMQGYRQDESEAAPVRTPTPVIQDDMYYYC